MKNQTSKWWILGLMAVAQFMVTLDTVVVNVALPALKQGLHFSNGSLQWVITAYALSFGGFLLLGGRAADLFGRRRMLLIGLAAFTTISLLIGLSESATQLVILRAAQGLAAAFMSPAALSIVLTTFREGNQRNTALGIWTAVAAGGAASGLLIGGVLTEYLGWRWDFFINVPVGVLLIAAALWLVPRHASEATHRQLDLPGAALVTGGLMALVYSLTQAPTAGWLSVSTLGFIALAAALLTGFVANEARVAHPLMPLSIFRLRNISGANIMIASVFAGMMGMFFLISLYVQTVLKFSPIETGLAFLPFPAILAIASTQVPRFIPRYGYKPFLVTGPIIMATAMALLVRLPVHGSYLLDVLPTILLLPLGMGITMVSLTIAATSGVPANEAGLASGLMNTSQQMGGALGLAVLSGLAASTATAAATTGVDPLTAIVRGDHHAFLADAVVLVVTVILGLTVIRSAGATAPRPAVQNQAN